MATKRCLSAEGSAAMSPSRGDEGGGAWAALSAPPPPTVLDGSGARIAPAATLEDEEDGESPALQPAPPPAAGAEALPTSARECTSSPLGVAGRAAHWLGGLGGRGAAEGAHGAGPPSDPGSPD
mmetsp:Transcript_23860/g.74589  ORF Transcript_23860/g.74589 Transcript_23860/m.74589 type:complete len:124 (+) Transcript_23860:1275-1646(+)